MRFGGLEMVAAVLALVPAVARADDAVPTIAPPVGEDRGRAVACLSEAIVYEAGLEPIEGQQAVAQVIMNRLHNPRFPKSVCGVVFQGSERRTGCQFTFTCDNSLRRRLPERLFTAARAIAEDAIDARLPDRVQDAINYHAFYVAPRWAPSLVRLRQIGAHIFYRDPGALTAPPANAYAGAEPQLTATALAALPRSGGAVSPVPMPAAAPGPFTLWGLAVDPRHAPVPQAEPRGAIALADARP